MNSSLKVWLNFFISGWGRFSDNVRNASEVLRGVQNIIITNEECAAVYGTRIVIPSTICMRTAGQATVRNFINFGINQNIFYFKSATVIPVDHSQL
jgi:hypothetical protein